MAFLNPSAEVIALAALIETLRHRSYTPVEWLAALELAATGLTRLLVDARERVHLIRITDR